VDYQARVLLVEDDPPLGRSLTKFLERAGYVFESCSTAREALVLVQKHHHDIVISEFRLPDADGVRLLEQLKRVVPGVKAILISEFDLQAVASEVGRLDVHASQKPSIWLISRRRCLPHVRVRLEPQENHAISDTWNAPVGSRGHACLVCV